MLWLHNHLICDCLINCTSVWTITFLNSEMTIWLEAILSHVIQYCRLLFWHTQKARTIRNMWHKKKYLIYLIIGLLHLTRVCKLFFFNVTVAKFKTESISHFERTSGNKKRNRKKRFNWEMSERIYNLRSFSVSVFF